MSDIPTQPNKGFIAAIERTGNRLPDPVFIFIWLIGILMVVSLIASLAGLSAIHPVTGDPVDAKSLLSADNLRRLVTDMPTTFTHFHPLGYVLVVMLGAGVAERTGFLGAAMRAGVSNAPKMLLTPIVVAVGMIGNLAADAAYVVLIPLAGVIFAAAGRHPVAGIAAAFAGVSGGFSANLFPGQLDALLFGITEAGAEILDPEWNANIAGNWYLIMALFFVYLPVIWYVTDRQVEPRLGKWEGGTVADTDEPISGPLTDDERKGLIWGALTILAVIAVWVFLTIGPGTPLIDHDARPEARMTPFYQSLVAGFFFLFLLSGWVYGHITGVIANHRDLVRLMKESMSEMGYYLVLAFAAAHFVVMFVWSNLGLILAIDGAEFLRWTALPGPLLLAGLLILSGFINLFVGSASAKWALLAPILVPMLMLLGISPETATAAYRIGDSATNIITPLMVYFPLILIFCQRWDKEFGIGSLMAVMIPYSIWLMISGVIMIIAWTALNIPLGPGAMVDFTLTGR
ncbi:AbgT family transporter [Hoeflea prorocentri]|uniref:AbgT family transporter n=1 Tax=Hoeflea prorocentri TaxID=1922333 RepID=A0A9X3ZJW9_9HYPH|nr:AbgT family transporter [Hoeflea prorocentri]MCY6383235.1 AbgT family transporter [Hoeflea prorocentri]MDA5401035.1 AbgT family transporter [Hoeflea prorocentri]